MDLGLSILMIMGRVLMETFTSSLFIFILLCLVVIISWQYKRLEKLSESLTDSRPNRYLHSALASTLLGFIGGVLGSILLVFAGIDLMSIGIMPLWIVALLLMLINPRFLCFAYAGGIISIANILFGYPDISVPQLMGLVAILHMIESLLILMNGQLNPVPVYVKKNNRLRGGFNLQKFWPIPLVALVGSGMAAPTAGLIMPDWWPLLKDYGSFAYDQSYTLLPVLAVLGYGEITTTSTPARRVRKSALHLFVFSFILLMLSLLAARWSGLLLVAALFSPLGHEFIIWLGMREEANKPALFVEPPQGAMVLDVKPHSSAARAGIRSGDIITSINGEIINTNKDLYESLNRGWGFSTAEIMRDNTILKLVINRDLSPKAGIITVPDYYTPRYLSLSDDNIFTLIRHLWRKFKR